jgi:hypothetical protein
VAAIPDLRVFEDPRFQAYPLEFIAGIEDAYRSQSEWDKLGKDLDWAVLSKGHYFSALSGGGRFPPQQWTPASQDRSFLILVRRSGKFGAPASRPAAASVFSRPPG